MALVRHPGDDYFNKPQYGDNPWIVCTLWLAQYYLGIGRTEEACALLDWAMARRLPSGVLASNSDPETGYQLGVAP